MTVIAFVLNSETFGNVYLAQLNKKHFTVVLQLPSKRGMLSSFPFSIVPNRKCNHSLWKQLTCYDFILFVCDFILLKNLPVSRRPLCTRLEISFSILCFLLDCLVPLRAVDAAAGEAGTG